MRNLLLILCFILSSNLLNAQDYNYNQRNFNFLGYKEEKLIYKNRGNANYLFSPQINDEFKVISFLTLENINTKNIWFLNNEIKIEHSVKEKITVVTYKGNRIEILKGIELTNRNMVAYLRTEKILIIAYDVATTSMLVLCDLAANTTEFLPIIGSRPIFSNGYLYFSAKHICDWYSAYIDDVYRVKIGDWDNPELVLQNTEPTWVVLPNSNIIYADILEDRTKRILFNADTKTYAITDYIGSSTIVKYKGEHYYQMKQYNKPISFKPIKFADSYPNKDERVLCPTEKKKIINLSNAEKPFPNTFITEELLYNSTNKELSELKKEELRLLRNAFIARQGYQFKSQDLQEFFGQFEWYHKMVERNKYLELSNEDVVISPKDKERVELILEIENNK